MTKGGLKTLIVKNADIPLDEYRAITGDCLLCGSVGALHIGLYKQVWACSSCEVRGLYDNIQIKMKVSNVMRVMHESQILGE